MEDSFSDKLFSDTLNIIYEKLKKKILEELKTKPYAIVRIRWLKKELKGKRGLQYIIKKLALEYNVTKMGSWYIIREKKPLISEIS